MNKGIQLNNVSFSYDSKTTQLKDVSLKITKGTFLGITGINGSGKTTFGLLLNGLIPHEIDGKMKGEVLIDEISTKKKPVSYFAGKVGMLFQNPDFMLFNLTVFDEIAFGLTKQTDLSEKVDKALEMVGLKGFAKRDPQTLSLGEKQKLCLASVLARDSEYIVLDEPVAMLDYKGAINLYGLLRKLNKDHGKTIIVIEHDTDFLLKYADEIIILDQGAIVLEGKPSLLISQREELKRLGVKIPQPIL